MNKLSPEKITQIKEIIHQKYNEVRFKKADYSIIIFVTFMVILYLRWT